MPKVGTKIYIPGLENKNVYKLFVNNMRKAVGEVESLSILHMFLKTLQSRYIGVGNLRP